MKKNLVLLATLIIAFVLQTQAQDCFMFLPQDAGTKLETKYFNKKGKETSTVIFTILKREQEAAQERLDVRLETKGVKADSIVKREFSYYCKDGVMYVDMENYLSDQLNAYQNMTIEVDADKLDIPSNPTAGQVLKGGEVIAKVLNNGFQIMKIKVLVSDRKVEKIETLKTPAGEFECIKIYQKTLSKMGFIKVKGATAEWFSKDVGVVRSESYNKKGKLISYSELQKITRP